MKLGYLLQQSFVDGDEEVVLCQWLINPKATCQLAVTCDNLSSPHTFMCPESGNNVVVRDFDGNVLSSQPLDGISFDGI